MWVTPRDGKQAEVHIYDTTSTPDPPPIDERIAVRIQHLLPLISSGTPYLELFTLGLDRRSMYGSVVMMKRISSYIEALLETKEEMPPLLRDEVLPPEIYNTWLVLNGAMMVTSYDGNTARYYASYFGISVSHPYVMA